VRAWPRAGPAPETWPEKRRPHRPGPAASGGKLRGPAARIAARVWRMPPRRAGPRSGRATRHLPDAARWRGPSDEGDRRGAPSDTPDIRGEPRPSVDRSPYIILSRRGDARWVILATGIKCLPAYRLTWDTQ